MRTLSPKEERIRHLLSREEFLYGLLRSDFLYYIPLDKNSTVLDVGCGWGTHSFNAARISGMVYGCDSSKEKITFCRERINEESVNNVEFLHSKVIDIQLKPATFDAILIHDLSLWSVEERYKNLQFLYGLLKPGGSLYFGTESTWGNAILRMKYKRMLHKAGFMKKPDFYIASPNYHLPRFLIPHRDTQALKFILISMTAYRGIIGSFVRFFVSIPGGVSILRDFFHSYAVFIKK